MSKGGRYASNNKKSRRQTQPEQTEQVSKPRKVKRRKSPVQVVLTVILVLVVLVVSAMIALSSYFYGMSRMFKIPEAIPSATQQVQLQVDPEQTGEPQDAVETTEAPTVPTTLPYVESGKDIINVLVVGQSGRNGETEEAAKYADTSMLFTVNKNTKTLTMTSILRDTYVKLPDFVDANGKEHTSGKNRINTAYALGYQWGDTGGAMQMMNECLYNNFGIEVDYNVEVDFEGFIAVIDSIGGVEIEITQAEADYLNKDDLYGYEDVEAGKVRMNGMTALSYARMRKASGDGESDIKRSARQRNLIVSLLKQVSSMSFDELRWAAKYAMGFVTTNMSKSDINTLLWEILPTLFDLKIESGTCPIDGDQPDVVVDDVHMLGFTSKTVRAMKAITEGIPAE